MILGDASWAATIGVRWLHVISACLLVGATFFFYAILPRGARSLDEQSRQSVLLGLRHPFKMLVHPMILFLLGSGAYNAWSNWRAYRNNMPLTHALLGPHIFLGIVIFTILLVILSGKEPRRTSRTWLGITVLLLFVTVAIASSLKYAREHPKSAHQVTEMSATHA